MRTAVLVMILMLTVLVMMLIMLVMLIMLIMLVVLIVMLVEWIIGSDQSRSDQGLSESAVEERLFPAAMSPGF